MRLLFYITLLTCLSVTFAFLRNSVWQRSYFPKVSASKRRSSKEKIDFDASLRQCRFSKDFSPAIKLAEKALLLRPMPSSLLTGVIKVFGEANQLGRAVSLFKVMKEEMNIVPNGYHLSALIVACRRCGQWEMAVALYNRTDSLGIKKNTVICNGIISTLGDALQWETVCSILSEMDTLGIKKDIVTYSSAITACTKAGEWQHAIKIYRLMLVSGITPNTITFNSVLNACARGRQVKMALDFFSEASSRGIVLDTISYSVVIKVCAEMNEFQLALEIFNAMENRGVDTPIAIVANDTVVTSATLPISLSTPDATSIVVNQKTDHPLITFGWNSSSLPQFSADYIKTVIASCRAVPRDTGCFNAIITSCERAGDWKTALALINRMGVVKERERKVGYEAKIRPDCKTFSAAISCLGKAGQWDQASALFYRMDEEGIKKDTAVYNAMIAALQLEGQKRLKEEASLPLASVERMQPLMTSTMLFEMVQQLYSEGLEDGQLQHWAYDVDDISGKGNRDRNVETRKKIYEGLGLDLVDHDNDINNEESHFNDSSVIQSIASSTSGGSIGAASILSIMEESIYADIVLSRSFEDLKRVRLLGTTGTDGDNNPFKESFVPFQLLNASNMNDSSKQQDTDSTQGVLLPDFDDFVTPPSPLAEKAATASKSQFFSIDTRDPLGTILPSHRKLDLHGYPLSVAKAAIDYEFKNIYDGHCEDIDGLVVTEEVTEGVHKRERGSATTFDRGDNDNDGASTTGVRRSSSGSGGADGYSINRDIRSSRRNRIKKSFMRTDNLPKLTEPLTVREVNRLDTVVDPLTMKIGRLESSYDLYVITGRGRHINNSGTRGVLRNEIRDYILNTYNIKTVRIDGNDGCIIVTRASLIDWFREMDQCQ